MPHPAAARTLVAGDLDASVLPEQGMLVASLRHRGVELLRRVQDLATAAARGSSAGIPLLHPWANRLASLRYQAAGLDVALDPASPLLHFDQNGLPMHGVPWSRLVWNVTEASRERIAARLDWSRPELLALFPFAHRLELVATLRSDGLTFETTLIAGDACPVPVAFGFHPYLGLPNRFGLSNLSRAEWRLRLPAMRRLALDGNGIPTGEESDFEGFDAPLGDAHFDDGFSLIGERASFSIAGADRQITVELLAGYPYAQVFAPRGQDYVALEPMTAPANALVSGRGLRLVEPGAAFRAAFRVGVGRS